MSAMDIGRKLVAYCKDGKYKEAVEDLYADDAVHIEAMDGGPDCPRETRGKDAILKSTEWWMENMEVHDSGISGPYPHGEEFIVPMWSDTTPKAGPMAGQRMKMDEVCRYTVKDGKISEVRFYYDMPGG